VCAVALAWVLVSSAASGQIFGGGKKNENQPRSLEGVVTDNGDKPLQNAIVYLKNTKTLAVRTFISGADGKYRFNGLARDIDYEVYAEHNGKRSSTKTLSGFDTRASAYIVLHIDTGAS
jgi:hypothetical protein